MRHDYGIRANGTDPTTAYGAIVKTRNISAPTKKVVMETVPYMDGFYDFSNLGSGPHYEFRTLEYELTVYDENPVTMFSKLEGVRNWLNAINGTDFYDEVYPNSHFTNATTTKVSTSVIGPNGATVKATITCDPDMS